MTQNLFNIEIVHLTTHGTVANILGLTSPQTKRTVYYLVERNFPANSIEETKQTFFNWLTLNQGSTLKLTNTNNTFTVNIRTYTK